MNKTLWSVSILVSSAFLLAGCTIPGISQPQSQQPAAQTMSEAAKFAKAIESGTPTICTMTKGQDTMEYSIKGKKMRIKSTNITTDDKGVSKTTIAHMINDEKFFYTWEDTTKQGTKMSLLIPSPSPLSSAAPLETAPKLDTQDDYDKLQNEGYTITCKAGGVDDSVFTPPTDVKFIDPAELMRNIPSPAANGQIDMNKIQELQKQYESQ